jgi:beta-glucosidase
MKLGLFDNPYTDPTIYPDWLNNAHKEAAKKAAVQSMVLLQNSNNILPLDSGNEYKIALTGPLADAAHEQLGTWTGDGDREESVTVLQAMKESENIKNRLFYAPGLEYSRSMEKSGIEKAVKAANNSDVVLLVLGEESILSGEAHSRADINLPGAQQELVEELAKSEKPIIAVIMAGRPLTIRPILDKVDAVIYAWHPGTMAGPALVDLIFGIENPSGKLPVTFPTTVGQIPIYYAKKNTGRPPSPESLVNLDEVPAGTGTLHHAFKSQYLDEGYEPLYPFGFGLSYTTFEYSNISISDTVLNKNGKITVSAIVKNSGTVTGEEIVQFYVRDLVGDRSRPVRELKGFTRIKLEPGKSKEVSFTLRADDLAFTNRSMITEAEPGDFMVWIGGSSRADLGTRFRLR